MGILFKLFTLLTFSLTLLSTTGCNTKTNLTDPPLASIEGLSDINGNNEDNYSLSGICQGGIESVRYIIGSQRGTVDCDEGNWKVTGINLTSEAEGKEVSITVSFINTEGKEISHKTAKITKDTLAPSLSNTDIEVPEDATYTKDSNLDFIVDFEENVVVKRFPKLSLTVGSTSRYANYLSGSGTSSLTFRYVVQGTDEDSNGIEIADRINTRQGGILDQSGNSLPNSSLKIPLSMSILVDGTQPILKKVTGNAGSYKTGVLVPLAAVFSENVKVEGRPALLLRVGTSQVTADLDQSSSSPSSSRLVFNYQVKSGQNDSDGIEVIGLDRSNGKILDINDNPPPSLPNPLLVSGVNVDTTAPTLRTESINVPPNGSYAKGNLDFTVNFSEKVWVPDSGSRPQLILLIGESNKYAEYLSGSGTSSLVFRYTILYGDIDPDGISLKPRIDTATNERTIRDKAGNDMVQRDMAIPNLSGIHIDAQEVILDSITATSGSYKQNAVIALSAIFNGDVTVNVNSSPPQTPPRLNLNVGGRTVYAEYINGSGSRTLTFRYTVANGQNDDNGITVTGLDLNGGTIVNAIAALDGSHANAKIDLSAPIILSDVKVDTTAPTLMAQNIGVPSNGSYLAGNHLDFTVRLSENVVVNVSRGPPRLTLTIGSSTHFVNYIEGQGNFLTFRYTVQGGDKDTDGIHLGTSISLNNGTIRDMAGNDLVLSNMTIPLLRNILIDNPGPVLMSASGETNTYKSGDTVVLLATFNRVVRVNNSGAQKPQLTLNVGEQTAYANYASGSDSDSLTFHYVVSAGHNDANGISVTAIHLNGGTLTDVTSNEVEDLDENLEVANVKVDTTAPTPTTASISVPRSGIYGSGANLDFTVPFNENVIVDFSGGRPRLTLDVGGKAHYANYLEGSGTSSLIFRYLTGEEDEDNDGINLETAISPNGGIIQDAAGNDMALRPLNVPDVSGIRIDANHPTLHLVRGTADNYHLGQEVELRAFFSEVVKVSGVPQLTLDVGGQTAHARFVRGSDTLQLIFKYTVGSGHSDSDGIRVNRINLAGGTIQDTNGQTVRNLATPLFINHDVIVDAVKPIITDLSDDLTPRSSKTWNWGCSEDSCTYRHDVTTSPTPELSALNYTDVLTKTIDTGDGPHYLHVQAKDSHGNESSPRSFFVKLDNTNPTVSSQEVTAPTNSTSRKVGDPLDFTVTFSERVWVNTTGETKPRLTLTIGSTSRHAPYFSGSGTLSLTFRHVLVKGDKDTDGIEVANSIDLNSGSIKDEAGNDVTGSLALPSNLNRIDTKIPTIKSVTSSAGTHKANDPVVLEAVFSEVTNITGPSGWPRLVLQVGEDEDYAEYVSGAGTTTLRFRYTVSPNHTDDDGIVVSGINLGSAMIKDVDDNDMETTFSAPLNPSNPVKVDTSLPQVTGLENNLTPQQSNVWDWDCNESPCTFRHIVNTSSSHRFINTTYTTTQMKITDTGTDTFYIHVQAKDAAGNESSVQSARFILDNTAPALSSGNIGVPSNKTYTAGHLDFRVRFNENVIVNTDSGLPRLTLTIGTTTRHAPYFSGSGTRSLTFRHMLVKGDTDTDGIGVSNSIDLNGGSIKDGAGNEAPTTGLGIPGLSSVKASVTQTSLYSVTAQPGSYNEGHTVTFTVSFNGAVTVESTPQLVLNVGGQAVNVDYTSKSNNDLLFDYTVAASHNDDNGVSVTRLSLNGGAIKNSDDQSISLSLSGKVISVDGVKVDTVTPLLASGNIGVPSNGTYKSGQNLDFIVGFNEDVIVNTDSGPPRLTLTVGTRTLYADYFSGSGTQFLTFRYTVQNNDLDSNGIGVALNIDLNSATIQDKASNVAPTTGLSIPSLGHVHVNATTPTLTRVDASNNNHKTGDRVELRAVFSELINVTGHPQLTLTIGDGADSVTDHANYISGSQASTLVFHYQVKDGHNDNNGIQVSGIHLNGGTMRDKGGNDVTTTLGNPFSIGGVKIDTSRPQVNGLSDDLVVKSNKTWNWSCSESNCTYLYHISTQSQHTFSSTQSYENVTSVTQQGGNGLHYLHVEAKDSAGNKSDIEVVSVTLDNTPPSLENISVPPNGVYTTGQNLDFTVRFSENVIITGAPRLTLFLEGSPAKRHAPHVVRAENKRELTFRYTIQDSDLDSDGVVLQGSIDLNGGTVRDVANNNAAISPLSVPNLAGILIDAKKPTLSSMTAEAGSYGPGDVVELRATFSEGMIVGEVPELSLTVGSKTDATASFLRMSDPTTLVFGHTVGATDNDNNSQEIIVTELKDNVGVIQDTNGNEFEPRSLNITLSNVSVDTTSPILAGNVLVPNDGDHTSGPLNFTVTFNEKVIVAQVPRLTLTVGTASRYADYFSGSGTQSLIFRYVIQTQDVDANGISLATTIDLNNGSIKDEAGNNAVRTGLSIPSLRNVKVNNPTFMTKIKLAGQEETLPSLEDPLGIMGLTKWLDSSDKETLFFDISCSIPWEERGSGPVGCWEDKSGHGHHYLPELDMANPLLTDIPMGSEPPHIFAVFNYNGEDILFSFLDEILKEDISHWMERGLFDHLREVVVYDGPLLEDDRVRIEEYLGRKWNFKIFQKDFQREP